MYFYAKILKHGWPTWLNEYVVDPYVFYPSKNIFQIFKLLLICRLQMLWIWTGSKFCHLLKGLFMTKIENFVFDGVNPVKNNKIFDVNKFKAVANDKSKTAKMTISLW